MNIFYHKSYAKILFYNRFCDNPSLHYKNIEEYYRFITPNVTKTYLIIKIDRYPPIIVLIYACYIYSTKYIYTRFCNISVSTVIFDL